MGQENQSGYYPKGPGIFFYDDDDGFSNPLFSADLVLSEGHTVGVTTTSSPVEQGAEITDHIRPNAIELPLELFLTSSPISSRYSDFVANYSAPTAGDMTYGGVTRIAEEARSIWKERLSKAYNDLSRLVRGEGADGYKLIKACTSIKIYRSLAIVEVSMPRESSTEESAKISVKLREIRIAKSKTGPVKNVAGMVAKIAVPAIKKQAAVQAQPTTNAGAGTTKDAGTSWAKFAWDKKDPLGGTAGAVGQLFRVAP